MTYEEFKKEFRVVYPTASNRTMKYLYGLQHILADTPPMTNQELWHNNQKEEGINPMYDECAAPCKMGFKAKATVANAQIINAVPVESTQRDYAIARIEAIGEKHVQSLRVQFNMDDITPGTFLELEKLIKDGNYTVSDKAKEPEARYGYIFYGVKFGQPTDKDGYEAAGKVLKIAAQKAVDKATLGSPDQLEAVIDDFEAWKL